MSEVQQAFEAVVSQIEHDPAFADIEVVTHAVGRRGAGLALTLTIDRVGGVDIGSCERVAAHVNDALEACAQPYSLEVESAGLERPLLRPGDYQRFAGKNARIVTTLAIGGAKTHRGTLHGVVGTNVELLTPAGTLPIPLAAIRSANLEYDPRADLAANKRERKRHG